MELRLEANEAAMLAEVLERYLSDLRVEITDTDNPNYRRELREERESLEGILTRLKGVS
jgi:hypothetical protein